MYGVGIYVRARRLWTSEGRKDAHENGRSEIEGFFCDSVMAEFPIYTDGEHAELDAVLVKTKDGVVWYLKENDDDEITYEKNSEKDVKLFKQLENIKPDKIYILPNEPQFFVAEKDGKKQKMKR